MKQIKKHIKRLHKIKVHHNRWFIWTIVISVTGLFLLVMYINISSELINRDLADSSALFNQGVMFKDSYLGFSVRHPLNWGVESQDRNIIEFNNPYNFGEGFSVGVFDAKDAAVIKQGLNFTKEEQITAAGEPSILLSLQKNTQDGSNKAVLIPHGDKLYVIKGNAREFNGIVKSFAFVPKVSN